MNSKDNISEIEQKHREWEAGCLKDYLKTSPEREIFTELPAKRLYTPLDKPESAYVEDIGFPGAYPFTRGITPTMYRSKIWAMAEYSGFGSAKDSSERHKYLLSQGNTQIAVAADIPTQLGYDADDPEVESEVGLMGTSLSSLMDIEEMLSGIPMDQITIRGSTSTMVLVLWAMYTVAAKKKGIPFHKIKGDAKIDVMDEYLGRGNYIFPPEHSVRLSLDLVEYGLTHIPDLTYQINSYTIHEQGSTVIQEGAYALACGLFYLDQARKRGTISIGDFAAHLTQHPAVHTHIFEEVAKSRAMRRLWARLVKQRYNPENVRALQCVIDPNTGGSVLTARQAENNLIRIALAVLGAALGGSTYIAPCSFDEALAIPTQKSVTLSLRAQQIIAYESGASEVVDPLGGSYYVESLTDAAEKGMMEYIDKIERKGGLLEVIKSGWMKRDVARSAYLKQKAIEEGKRTVVGLNRFTDDEETSFELHKPNPSLVQARKESLKKLRAERDSRTVEASLQKLRKAAKGTDNLMPYLQEAVGHYATIGEIAGVFREVFGEYKPAAF